MKRLFLITCLVLGCLGTGAQELDKDTRYGVVEFSTNFMREKPGVDQELGDQALMGTLVKILGKENSMFKITSPEPYTAWVYEMGIVELSYDQAVAYLEAPKYICTVEYSNIYSEPSPKSQRISDFILGNIVRVWAVNGKAVKKGGFLGVMLPSGKTGYVSAKDVAPFKEWAQKCNPTEDDIIATASKFLGRPYLWGGTSCKAMDCSGFSRTTYFANGILLMRNASQQTRTGDEVDASGILKGDFSALKKGDLIFFGKPSTGKVTHVTIYIGDGKIIHASQYIRINSLREGDPDYYTGTKNLINVRRILGTQDQGKGVISTKNSPWYFPQK